MAETLLHGLLHRRRHQFITVSTIFLYATELQFLQARHMWIQAKVIISILTSWTNAALRYGMLPDSQSAIARHMHAWSVVSGAPPDTELKSLRAQEPRQPRLF